MKSALTRREVFKTKSKLALRARGVNPVLDPGGSGKGLVETSKGLCSPV